MDTLVQPAINLIKANNLPAARILLIQAMNNLQAWNVDAIVLGCTELPLAIRDSYYNKKPLINSIDSLVHAAIKEFRV
jgi:aspartate racemase